MHDSVCDDTQVNIEYTLESMRNALSKLLKKRSKEVEADASL